MRPQEELRAPQGVLRSTSQDGLDMVGESRPEISAPTVMKEPNRHNLTGMFVYETSVPGKHRGSLLPSTLWA